MLVNGWDVIDFSRARLLNLLVDLAQEPGPTVAVPLHVQALSRPTPSTLQLASQVNVAYADGWSVALLARLAGARRVERSTTTYLAHDILDELGRVLGRDVRIALLGGPPGLAQRAARTLAQSHPVQVTHCGDGFGVEAPWHEHIKAVAARNADIVFVGLGYPKEGAWAVQHAHELNAPLIMTCGGLFGYLAGEETTAPPWVRRIGLEWAWRLLQSPRRLSGRYVRGSGNLIRLAVLTICRRFSHRTR